MQQIISVITEQDIMVLHCKDARSSDKTGVATTCSSETEIWEVNTYQPQTQYNNTTVQQYSKQTLC